MARPKADYDSLMVQEFLSFEQAMAYCNLTADEMKELVLSQYSEYKFLEKRLGKAARMTIAPVVKFDPAENKALEDLRTECRKN